MACVFTHTHTKLHPPGKIPEKQSCPREVKGLPPLSLLTVLQLYFWTSLITV